MVGHSEHAWRVLARKYGADICYTEMVHAEVFLRINAVAENNRWFTTDKDDRPLVVQICGNKPELMLAAARKLERHCDAIDVNLGCPQNIAKRGHYGAFLQDDWSLVGSIVSLLSQNLRVPVFCKIRIFEDVDRTVEYARMLETCGCSLLAVHGRRREQRGVSSGLASWRHIRAVKAALGIPVVANGNILEFADIGECVSFTGCDGVMVAETHLHNPLVFSGLAASPVEVFSEYLCICESIKGSRPNNIRPHFFKVFHVILRALPHYMEDALRCTTVDEYRRLLGSIEREVRGLDTGQQRHLMALHPRIRDYRRTVAELVLL
ncbi:UNVERIFIED_CONTAM: hypothetical protein PYX00_011567 [Menopon gallinae]|uniref:tRNA-dihydrouridine(16/17) synthase [NAD(P)(+)] n=1 Tax=Menopon gallinae TaxID=328185 RepID=A0AAW2H7W2_9NEOP